MTAEPATQASALRACTAHQVAAYLRAHPGFLAARPELFAVLEPPTRVHGPKLADHMVAMVQAARLRATETQAQSELVLAAGRAAAGIAERVQKAVLAVLGAADVADCVAETWPGLLGVDAAALCCESLLPRWRQLPQGSVDRLLQDKSMVFRDRPADAPLLHAEAALLAERDLLVRLPGNQPALLALVSRDAASLPNTQGWLFLGRVLAILAEGSDSTGRPTVRLASPTSPRIHPREDGSTLLRRPHGDGWGGGKTGSGPDG